MVLKHIKSNKRIYIDFKSIVVYIGIILSIIFSMNYIINNPEHFFTTLNK